MIGVAIFSLPSGANGFGRPSVPSGVRVMPESCRELKALSEKMASFNFIFLTFKRRVKNPSVIEESPFPVIAPEEVSVEGKEETKIAVSFGDALM